MSKTVKFWGSEEHLNVIEKGLKEGGFDKCEEHLSVPDCLPRLTETRAQLNPGPSISYEIVPDIENCIRKTLSTHQLRLFKQKIVITGDLAAKEIKRLLECSRDFDVAKG